MRLTVDEAVEKMVQYIRDLDDADDIADALELVCGGHVSSNGNDWVEFEPEAEKVVLKGSLQNEFELPEKAAKEGVWLTVGKASVYVRQSDEGVGVDIYPLDKENNDAVASAWALDSELEGE
jgi:hypothetical protein